MESKLPRMMAVRQEFPTPPPLDVCQSVEHAVRTGLSERIVPDSRIAVAVGSRGIKNLLPIVRCLVDQLKTSGAKPFIVTAMGLTAGPRQKGKQTYSLVTA